MFSFSLQQCLINVVILNVSISPRIFTAMYCKNILWCVRSKSKRKPKLWNSWVCGLCWKRPDNVVKSRLSLVNKQDRDMLQQITQKDVHECTIILSDDWRAYKSSKKILLKDITIISPIIFFWSRTNT